MLLKKQKKTEHSYSLDSFKHGNIQQKSAFEIHDTCTCISKTHKEKNTQTNKNKTLLMYINKTKQNKTKQKTKQN